MRSQADPAGPSSESRALLDRLRNGRPLSDKEAERFTRAGVVDALRPHINRADLSWLWFGIHTSSEPRAGFYLSLLKPLAEDEEVHRELLTMWKTALPPIRFHLMWPILDKQDLCEQIHEDLFEFVFEHWNVFMPKAAQFLAPPDAIIAKVIRRLGDPLFPESKGWAYLCCLPEYADDQETARALLRVGLKMNAPFTRIVAERLLARFFPDGAS